MSGTQSPPVVENTGPVLLGNFFNYGLMGVLLVQGYIYYIAFPNDRMLPKAVVVWILIVEVVQTILCTCDAFRVFGVSWGNWTELNNVGLGWFSIPFMSVIITLTVQSFYAWRIWILSKSVWMPFTIVFLSVTQGVAGLYTAVDMHIIGVWSQVRDRIYVSAVIWLVGTALCDMLIAATMVFYLRRSKSGFQSTTLLLTRIIRIVMETGIICAAMSILDLGLYLKYYSNYHLAVCFIVSKLYSNSMLVLLNARVRINGGRMTDASFIEDSTLSIGHTTSTRTYDSRNRTVIPIKNLHTDRSDATSKSSNEVVESNWKQPSHVSELSTTYMSKPKVHEVYGEIAV